ncbi:MAG TPA: dihydroxyacetone kinase subunit DhaL [Anaerolineales bacterium]|nr:dihydroxyacetone kinase subunit DhaL [Anaerolineales bacterium]
MLITRDDVLKWIRAYAAVIAENRDYLIELDSAIGDADHGANMDRGFRAVLARLPDLADKDIGTILKTTGMTLVSSVGGAGGPLYGTFFLQAGMKTGGKMDISLSEWVGVLEAAVEGVMARGKAEPGDKTMLDALVPAVRALVKSQADGVADAQALMNSAEAARLGMQATIPMIARKGRASYLGDRSAGHQDPGATSSYLLIRAAADTWADA